MAFAFCNEDMLAHCLFSLCQHFWLITHLHVHAIVLFKIFMYLFLGRREGMEKERDRNINMWLPLVCSLQGTWPRNPGMCPDGESNQGPFGLQAGAQSTEPHQPGLLF